MHDYEGFNFFCECDIATTFVTVHLHSEAAAVKWTKTCVKLCVAAGTEVEAQMILVKLLQLSVV